jgi:hypothetical protein
MGQFQAIVIVDGEVADMSMWNWRADWWTPGCMLALVWGKDCDAWREALEDAALEAADYEDVPAERAVVVTAHEDDELEAAFWYARHRAAHPATGAARNPDRAYRRRTASRRTGSSLPRRLK